MQPGDGFGLLLPHESLPLELSFSPRKPWNYTFDLICKTGSDRSVLPHPLPLQATPTAPPSTYHRTYKLPCQGTGVLPPLSLSSNAISFCPTAVGDRSRAVVTLSNPRLGRLHSAVIRGAVLPQGPKAFEFLLPPDCPFSVSPRVGVVQPGEVRARCNGCHVARSLGLCGLAFSSRVGTLSAERLCGLARVGTSVLRGSEALLE